MKKLREMCGVTAPNDKDALNDSGAAGKEQNSSSGSADGQMDAASNNGSQQRKRSISSVSNVSFHHTQNLISHKEHVAEIHNLTHQVKTLQLERDRLYDELVVRKLVEQENVKLNTQLSSLRQQFDFLLRFVQKSVSQGENAALAELTIFQNEWTQNQKDNDKKHLQEAYVKLDHEARDALQSQEDIARTLHEENMNLQNVLKELNTLQSQNDNLRRQSEATSSRLTRKNRELHDLQKQLDLEREKNDEYADILHAARMEQMSTDILKSEIQSKRSGMKSLQHQLTMAQRENKRLKAQLKQKKGSGRNAYNPSRTMPSNSELIKKRTESSAVQRHNSMDVLSIWNSSYDEYSEQHRRRQLLQQQQEYNDTDSNDPYFDEESEASGFYSQQGDEEHSMDEEGQYQQQQQEIDSQHDQYENSDSPSTAKLVYDMAGSPRSQQFRDIMKRKKNPHPLTKKPLSKIQREADQKLSVLSKSRNQRPKLAPLSGDGATSFASASAGLARRQQQGMQLNASSIRLQQQNATGTGGSAGYSRESSNTSTRNVFSAEFGARFIAP